MTSTNWHRCSHHQGDAKHEHISHRSIQQVLEQDIYSCRHPQLITGVTARSKRCHSKSTHLQIADLHPTGINQLIVCLQTLPLSSGHTRGLPSTAVSSRGVCRYFSSNHNEVRQTGFSLAAVLAARHSRTHPRTFADIFFFSIDQYRPILLIANKRLFLGQINWDNYYEK